MFVYWYDNVSWPAGCDFRLLLDLQECCNKSDADLLPRRNSKKKATCQTETNEEEILVEISTTTVKCIVALELSRSYLRFLDLRPFE